MPLLPLSLPKLLLYMYICIQGDMYVPSSSIVFEVKNIYSKILYKVKVTTDKWARPLATAKRSMEAERQEERLSFGLLWAERITFFESFHIYIYNGAIYIYCRRQYSFGVKCLLNDLWMIPRASTQALRQYKFRQWAPAQCYAQRIVLVSSHGSHINSCFIQFCWFYVMEKRAFFV